MFAVTGREAGRADEEVSRANWQPVLLLLNELFPHDERNANDPNLVIKMVAAGSMNLFDQVMGL